MGASNLWYKIDWNMWKEWQLYENGEQGCENSYIYNDNKNNLNRNKTNNNIKKKQYQQQQQQLP